MFSQPSVPAIRAIAVSGANAALSAARLPPDAAACGRRDARGAICADVIGANATVVARSRGER